MNTIITIARQFGSGGRELGRRIAEALNITNGLGNHQVDIERLTSQPFERLHYRETKRDIRHEDTIHDVHMNPLCFRLVEHLDGLTQSRKIRRKNRR